MPLPTLQQLVEMLDAARSTLITRSCFYVGDASYGVRDFTSESNLAAEYDRAEHIRFAEDDCGNYFIIDRSKGAVGFRDHETNEIVPLASSLQAFLDALAQPPEARLEPGQVIEAWIDPDFLAGLK